MAIGREVRRAKTLGWFLTELAIVFFWAVSGRGEGEFKMLPGTQSLDGAYGLAYGIGNPNRPDLADLKEAPAADELFDQSIREEARKAESSDPPAIWTYLVDMQTRRPVSFLPDFHCFPGNNHPPLEIGWFLDHRQALAIDYNRWNCNAIAWIEPREGRVTEVRQILETEFRRLLVRREGKAYTAHADRFSIAFSDPMIPREGELILGLARAYVPKAVDMKDFDYRLKFKVVRNNGELQFVLVGAHRGGDWYYDQPIWNDETGQFADPKDSLEEAYHALRKSLRGNARVALVDEQATWMRLVDALSESRLREVFIQRRARELALRAHGFQPEPGGRR
jgi:hypothetical protein